MSEDFVAALGEHNLRIKKLEDTVKRLQERIAELEGGSTGGTTHLSVRTTAASGTRTPSARGPPKGVAPVLKARAPPTPGPLKRSGSVTGAMTGFSESYNIKGKKVFVERPAAFKDMTPSDAEPSSSLELEYVYGFNGDNRNNLAWTADEKLVYGIAATGVVHDTDANTQRHFLSHIEDITCFAIHPNKSIVATGQRDVKGKSGPYTCVWNTSTMEVLAKIEYHDRYVLSAAFSTDGSKLITVGADDAHTLAVWDWEANASVPLMSFELAKDEVFGIKVIDSLSSADAIAVASFGMKHLRVTTVKKTSKWEASSVIPNSFEVTKKVQAGYHSVADGNGFLFAGTHDGFVYVFNGQSNKLIKIIKISDNKPVTCLATGTVNGAAVFFAASAGVIKVFDVASYNAVDTVPLPSGTVVRSLDYHAGRDTFAVGTKVGEILLVGLTTKQSKVENYGFSGEVWGVAPHPSASLVVACSHDQSLQVYDYSTNTVSNTIKLKDAAHSVAFNADGTLLAVGHTNGSVVIYNFDASNSSVTSRYSGKPHKETVSCILFTPDSSKLVTGSYDQTIVVLDIKTSRVLGAMKGHTSSIMAMTVSADGTCLVTDSRDYEYLFWDLTTCKRLTVNPDDVQWSTYNQMLGWNMQGIWMNTGDGSDINACTVSGIDGDGNDNRLVAVSTDMSEIRLYAYPVLHQKAKYKSYSGHSSHVTQSKFSHDQQFLFSSGGNDVSVMKWKLV